MEKITLNGIWDIRIDPEENGLAEHWAAEPIKAETQIPIPGCVQQLDFYNEQFPPIHDKRNSFLGTHFLEKIVSLTKEQAAQRVRICFQGVLPTCHLWINGEYVNKNIMGLNKIYLDITEYVKEGDNRITVAITEQYTSLVLGLRYNELAWAGIYSECYLEIGGAMRIVDEYISFKDGEAAVCGSIINDGEDFAGDIDITVDKLSVTAKIAVKSGEKKEFCVPIDATDLPRWSYRHPSLFDVKIVCAGTEKTFKTGLRDITMNKERIFINGEPTFFKGTGSEFFSPSICSVSKRDILLGRHNAIKAYGFNFFRYHTHVPTEEELCVADELGLMVSIEFGLITNFNKTLPYDLGLEMWEKYILQTRKHPSLLVYCAGNEGSQFLVDNRIYRNRATAAYNLVKKNTNNQLCIITFGMQSEVPEIPNDFETPHLWSESFKWAYDGLTDIPWDDLARINKDKPCVIHEYGKFGVWPSRKEEADTTLADGMMPDHATQAYDWLKRNGLEHLEEKLVKNSRKQANRLDRTALEEARRQPYVSGYALWTFFRRTYCNAGLSDDLGINLNGETELFTQGCNADVAILMERGFMDRAIPCGIEQSVGITISNFSEGTTDGVLKIALTCDGKEITSTSLNCKLDAGVTQEQTKFIFTVPKEYNKKKLALKADYTFANGESHNSWDFWSFDTTAEDKIVYLHTQDITLYRALKKVFPKAQRLSSVDSIIIGCRSWREQQLVQTASLTPETLIIADVYDDVVKGCIENGNKVLILDDGKLPDEWMQPPVYEDLTGDRDTGRFYNNFRACWGSGNLVSIIDDNNPLLGDFPQDGYCDFHFYDMVHTARSMKIKDLENIFGKPAEKVISSIAKVRAVALPESIFQDPNAIKEQDIIKVPTFNGREQGYLLKFGDKVAVTTLKLSDNPAGIGLLKNLVEQM